MDRGPKLASWRGWLQGAGWTLALVVLLVTAVGLVASTVIHAGAATTRLSAAEMRPAEGQAEGISTFPNWGWEWQQDRDPGPIPSPTHLR